MTTNQEPQFDFQLTFTDLLADLSSTAEKFSAPEAVAMEMGAFFGEEDFLSLESLGATSSLGYDADYDGQESVTTATECEFLCTGCMSLLRGAATQWYTCTECSHAGEAYEVCTSCHGNGCHGQHADFLELFTDPADVVEDDYSHLCGSG